jgi:hypothetical protein
MGNFSLSLRRSVWLLVVTRPEIGVLIVAAAILNGCCFVRLRRQRLARHHHALVFQVPWIVFIRQGLLWVVHGLRRGIGWKRDRLLLRAIPRGGGPFSGFHIDR